MWANTGCYSTVQWNQIDSGYKSKIIINQTEYSKETGNIMRRPAMTLFCRPFLRAQGGRRAACACEHLPQRAPMPVRGYAAEGGCPDPCDVAGDLVILSHVCWLPVRNKIQSFSSRAGCESEEATGKIKVSWRGKQMWLLWSGRLRGREEGHVAECILSALCTWQMYFLLAGVPVGIHYLLLTGYGDLEELKSPLFFFFFDVQYVSGKRVCWWRCFSLSHHKWFEGKLISLLAELQFVFWSDIRACGLNSLWIKLNLNMCSVKSLDMLLNASGRSVHGTRFDLAWSNPLGLCLVWMLSPQHPGTIMGQFMIFIPSFVFLNNFFFFSVRDRQQVQILTWHLINYYRFHLFAQWKTW